MGKRSIRPRSRKAKKPIQKKKTISAMDNASSSDDVLVAAQILMEMNLATEGSTKRPDPEAVAAFFDGLPRMPISSEDPTCSICLQRYRDPLFTAYYIDPPDPERPVKLPCGHILGKHCVRRWLDAGHDTCPLCRRKFEIKK